MANDGSGLDKAGPADLQSQTHSGANLDLWSMLVLSAWCGLVVGILETSILIIHKQFIDVSGFYGKSRHFVWLIPLADLVVFVALGSTLFVLSRCWVPLRRYVTRVLGTLVLLPLLLTAFPRIYGAALLLVATGAATSLIPVVARRTPQFRRLIRLSFPLAAGLCAILAASSAGAEILARWRETSRPLPPPSAPNILLIVLDTMAAEHLSLLGYSRPTSPSIDELAGRGICFKQAQTTAPWTLPAHASMFTGRFPHELSAGWLTPLDSSAPTVAEYLSARGYATAGFAANVYYCATDSGLARGFTTYRDFIFPALTVFHLTALVSRIVDGIQGIESACTYATGSPALKAPADLVWRLLGQGRKEAAEVNREFLEWNSARAGSARPFFVFLNYYDAHSPYELPATGIHRFGVVPRTDRETSAIQDWVEIQNRGPSARQIEIVRDAYDDCVAHLDEQLGILMDELSHRGVLDRTWTIITADHGESFGEHAGVFTHGKSLYQTESHVPLLIIPPRGTSTPKVVTEPVSLRDLAATIVDLSCLKAASPFPGDSLAYFWSAPKDTADSARREPRYALSELMPEDPIHSRSRGASDRPWPLGGLVDGDWSYTRREGDQLELLFNLHDDAGERRNLADDPAARPTLERMRKSLDQLTSGPLIPQRFNP